MSVASTAWVEDRDIETGGFQSLLQTQWNLNIIKFAAAVKVLTQNYSDKQGVTKLTETFTLAKGLPATALASVFSDPGMVYWNHVTQSLITRLRNQEAIQPSDVPHLDSMIIPERSPLESHLLDVNRFLVAAALVARESLSIDCVANGGRLYLPGLGIGIRIDTLASSVRVDTVAGQRRGLRLDHADFLDMEDIIEAIETGDHGYFEIGGIEVMPRMAGSSGSILLNPRDPYYRLGWILQESFPDHLSAQEVTNSDFTNWRQTLPATLTLLRDVWQEMESTLSQGLHTIVPISSPLKGKNLSCSAPCFWGAIMCSLDSAVPMAETLIHEFSHNLLYFLMDQYGILAPDCPRDAVYYSPWRSDARPLGGVLHGVYVFERVAEYYSRYLQQNPSSIIYTDRYSSTVARLVLGTRILETFARFNEDGRDFFERLSAKVHQHWTKGIRVMSNSVLNELDEHLSSWRRRYPDHLAPILDL